ncbi:unnamed protein product [Musa hybrid cultivar]
MANGEIIVVPYHDTSHIFPTTELASRLASRGYRVTLLLPSASSSSSALHPLIRIMEYSMPRPSGPPPLLPSSSLSLSCASPRPHYRNDCSAFRDLLAERFNGGGDDMSPPVCVIVDVMMSQLLDVCGEFGVLAVLLFTSSACSTAMDHAASKLSTADLGPGGMVSVPGLPEEMVLTAADLMSQGPPPLPFGSGDLAFEEVATGAHDAGPPPPLVWPSPPLPGLHGRPPPPPPDFGLQYVPLLPRGWGHQDGPPPPPPFQPGHQARLPPTQSRGVPVVPPPPPPPFLPGGGFASPKLPFGGGSPPQAKPATPSGPPLFRLGEGGGPTPPPGPWRGGGPQHDLAETKAVALLFNTCDALERPFLDYVADEAKKPVWGIGPLLPSQYWSATGSVIRDNAIRPKGRGDGDDAIASETDVLEFLDSKPRGSVIYISFGSLVVPSDAELAALASALEESSRPFIWAIQPRAMRHDADGRPVEVGGGVGYFPEGLAERAAGRGLVIHGWAPQLLILSHPATGGFVTHCGWNSTVEVLGRGVPVLTWPVHGDQVWNAKLVARRLRTGLAIKDERGAVTKAKVAEAIERLMSDVGTRERAAALAGGLFAGGFPASSEAALDALLDFVAAKCPR